MHLDFPKDETGKEFQKIKELKEKEIKEKLKKGDFDFEGTTLFEINATWVETKNSLNFNASQIRTDAQFDEAKVGGSVILKNVLIEGKAWFEDAKITGDFVENE